MSDLRENTAALSKGLAEQDEWSELVDIELSKCRANLMSIASKVRGETKKGANSIKSEIDWYLQGERKKETARNIYTRLNGLTQELHNLHEDNKWSE